jgi:DNA-binding protein HU-beta
LAEEHQLTKRACEAVLGDLVGGITKHLKKGERIRIAEKWRFNRRMQHA